MIVRTQLFRELANIASAMKEQEITFVPENEGLRVLIAPPSHIEMMTVRIPAAQIEDYAPGDAFALSAERFGKVLNTCGDSVQMDVTDKVVMKSGRMRCTLPMIAPAEGGPKMPDLDGFTSECVVSSDLVRSVSDAAPEQAMAVRFVLTETGLVMSSTGDDGVSAAEMDVPADECVMCEGEAAAMFTWVCWRAFLKGIPRGTEIDMRMADKYPLMVIFTTESGLEGRWMLAPWIEEE